MRLVVKRGRAFNSGKLKEVLRSIIYEQATCDLSGTKWAEAMLNKLDKALPDEVHK